MTRILILYVAFAGTCFGSAPTLAAAENIDVTISSEIAPVFQNGELTGCALSFQAGKNDFTYFGGDLALIDGSLNLYVANGKAPFYVLKLGVLRTGKQDYEAPSTAFIISDKGSNKGDFIKSIEAETPGFRMFAFSVGEASMKVMRETILDNKTIRIGYTIGDGSMSSIIPITLSMKKLNFDNASETVVDNDAPKKWLDCNLNALNAAITRVEAMPSN